MLVRFIALSLFVLGLPAQAGHLLDLEVVNRTGGEVLTTYRHSGQSYVAGNPGDGYSLRLVNRSSERVLAVLSVDGINVVTGETASPQQSGYVLEPYGSAEITGWRKSLREVAQFYFTALPDSYAARTDRPDNVGVIGVAVFREKARPQPPVIYPQSVPAPAGAAESAAGSVRSDNAFKAGKESAQRLGTGHGEREYAPTQFTEFERVSRSPNEVISLSYDSRANLMARGIIRSPRPAMPEPQPFPGWFVPDPRG